MNNILDIEIYIGVCWMKILSIERLAYWKCFIADVVYFSWYITYVYCLLSVAIFTARMISVILAFSNYAKACTCILIQIKNISFLKIANVPQSSGNMTLLAMF